jgi:hypothetical protein
MRISFGGDGAGGIAGTVAVAARSGAAVCREQASQAWQGASRRSYSCTVYTLIGCPDLPAVNYLMVRRHPDGSQQVLRIDHTTEACPSLNLARIRHVAARLGANEIHVLQAAAGVAERAWIAMDLQAGLFAELAPQPSERRPALTH